VGVGEASLEALPAAMLCFQPLTNRKPRNAVGLAGHSGLGATHLMLMGSAHQPPASPKRRDICHG